MTDATVKDVEKLQCKTSPWVAETTDDGKYVWHYCKYCGTAMNPDNKHKANCPVEKMNENQ